MKKIVLGSVLVVGLLFSLNSHAKSAYTSSEMFMALCSSSDERDIFGCQVAFTILERMGTRAERQINPSTESKDLKFCWNDYFGTSSMQQRFNRFVKHLDKFKAVQITKTIEIEVLYLRYLHDEYPNNSSKCFK
jgi:hypothetical protein